MTSESRKPRCALSATTAEVHGGLACGGGMDGFRYVRVYRVDRGSANVALTWVPKTREGTAVYWTERDYGRSPRTKD